MDPITHVAAGVLIGQSARNRFPAWRPLVPLAAFAAWMPDLDNVVILFGPEAFMRYHRGYTHCLLGATVLAFFLTLLAGRLRRGLPQVKLFGLFFLCVLSHLFLDLINSYGMSLFLPFSDFRIAMPAVFTIDPAFTAVLLVLAVASFLKPKARTVLALAGVAVMIGYPFANLGVRQIVTARAEKLLAAKGETPAAIHVQPDALAPLWWKIVVEEGNEYAVTGLDLLDPDRLVPERRFRKADRAEVESLGRQAPVFSQYLWFTDFLVKSASETAQGEQVTFQDLRFMTVNPLVVKVRGPAIPFTLTAELDPSGRLMRALFFQMGKPEVILPGAGEKPMMAGFMGGLSAFFR